MNPPRGDVAYYDLRMSFARSVIPLLAAVFGVLLAQGGWAWTVVACQPNTASAVTGMTSCDSGSAAPDEGTDDAAGCGCDPSGRTCCCAVSPARPVPQRVPAPVVPPGCERVDQTFFAFPPVAGLLPEPPTVVARVPASGLPPVSAGSSTRLEVLCRRQT
jgi:hypothetical protein